MSKKYGHTTDNPYETLEGLIKGCYELYKATHPEEDEYEYEKGEESYLNDFLRESGKVGKYLATSFYDIVIKGK
ncbi:hypothetical protein [Cellulosilyticum sp. I15G10I2]|uniref:hypothetical protein n=1 Tax=Cellulosilyticum sp. I15G10I2 TaxID=1892843 RepID=UPI00085C73B6|nr:hypothetical protein [Cellulosilyticum sp. I15G10I2]